MTQRIRIKDAALHTEDIITRVQNAFRLQGYQTQSFSTKDTSTSGDCKVIQVAAKSGIRAVTGMSQAATAKIELLGRDIAVSVDGAAWAEKLVAGGAGAILFAPLVFTSLVGAFKQAKLLGRLESTILSESDFLIREGILRDRNSSSGLWWTSLHENWKSFFRANFDIGEQPDQSDLERLFAESDIVVPNNVALGPSLTPLSRFFQLTRFCNDSLLSPIASLEPLRDQIAMSHLSCRFSRIDSLAPLRGLKQLEYLDCSNSPIVNVKALEGLSSLKSLKLNHTHIQSIEPLFHLPKLELLEVKCCTGIKRKEKRRFKELQPNCKLKANWF